MTKPIALIIEDDPQLSQIMTLTLKSDFETITITDGKTALSRLAEVIPAIVVLDLNLPGVSGKDILSNIRADVRLSKTRVILATADALQADLLSDEADIVLLKPVSPVQLREIAGRLRQMA